MVFKLNNGNKSLSIDSIVSSSTNFTKSLENDSDIFSKFLNSDLSIGIMNSSIDTSFHSDITVSEENDKKLFQ